MNNQEYNQQDHQEICNEINEGMCVMKSDETEQERKIEETECSAKMNQKDESSETKDEYEECEANEANEANELMEEKVVIENKHTKICSRMNRKIIPTMNVRIDSNLPSAESINSSKLNTLIGTSGVILKKASETQSKPLPTCELYNESKEHHTSQLFNKSIQPTKQSNQPNRPCNQACIQDCQHTLDLKNDVINDSDLKSVHHKTINDYQKTKNLQQQEAIHSHQSVVVSDWKPQSAMKDKLANETFFGKRMNSNDINFIPEMQENCNLVNQTSNLAYVNRTCMTNPLPTMSLQNINVNNPPLELHTEHMGQNEYAEQIRQQSMENAIPASQHSSTKLIQINNSSKQIECNASHRRSKPSNSLFNPLPRNFNTNVIPNLNSSTQHGEPKIYPMQSLDNSHIYSKPEIDFSTGDSEEIENISSSHINHICASSHGRVHNFNQQTFQDLQVSGAHPKDAQYFTDPIPNHVNISNIKSRESMPHASAQSFSSCENTSPIKCVQESQSEPIQQKIDATESKNKLSKYSENTYLAKKDMRVLDLIPAKDLNFTKNEQICNEGLMHGCTASLYLESNLSGQLVNPQSSNYPTQFEIPISPQSASHNRPNTLFSNIHESDSNSLFQNSGLHQQATTNSKSMAITEQNPNTYPDKGDLNAPSFNNITRNPILYHNSLYCTNYQNSFDINSQHKRQFAQQQSESSPFSLCTSSTRVQPSDVHSSTNSICSKSESPIFQSQVDVHLPSVLKNVRPSSPTSRESKRRRIGNDCISLFSTIGTNEKLGLLGLHQDTESQLLTCNSIESNAQFKNNKQNSCAGATQGETQSADNYKLVPFQQPGSFLNAHQASHEWNFTPSVEMKHQFNTSNLQQSNYLHPHYLNSEYIYGESSPIERRNPVYNTLTANLPISHNCVHSNFNEMSANTDNSIESIDSKARSFLKKAEEQRVSCYNFHDKSTQMKYSKENSSISENTDSNITRVSPLDYSASNPTDNLIQTPTSSDLYHTNKDTDTCNSLNPYNYFLNVPTYNFEQNIHYLEESMKQAQLMNRIQKNLDDIYTILRNNFTKRRPYCQFFGFTENLNGEWNDPQYSDKAITIFDQNLYTVAVSRGFLDLLGYTLDEMEHFFAPYFFYGHALDDEFYVEIHQQMIRSGVRKASSTQNWMKKDGSRLKIRHNLNIEERERSDLNGAILTWSEISLLE